MFSSPETQARKTSGGFPAASCSPLYLNCNVYADPTNNYLYVAVSDVYEEGKSPTNNYLLVYDCNGEKAQLVKNIHNQTNYTIGVFPINKFSNY